MSSFRPDVFEADPPVLLGSACTRCGGRAFPARDVCPSWAAPADVEAVYVGHVFGGPVAGQRIGARLGLAGKR
jgi:hypothetical protein